MAKITVAALQAQIEILSVLCGAQEARIEELERAIARAPASRAPAASRPTVLAGETCSRCQGSGEVFGGTCYLCHGDGIQPDTATAKARYEARNGAQPRAARTERPALSEEHSARRAAMAAAKAAAIAGHTSVVV